MFRRSVKEGSESLLSPEDFEKFIKIKGVQIVDVRTRSEYDDGHIKGADDVDVNAPGFVEKIEGKYNKDQSLALYCHNGSRSHRAAEMLAPLGYKVYILMGGLSSWAGSIG